MNIFRKLRSDSSGSSFLRYAIAEIILVVIGILIAVSINNWNEDRKAQKELNSILLTIKGDLKNDQKQLETIFNYHDQLEPLIQNVISDSMKAAAYLFDQRYLTLIIGYPEFSIDKRGFNMLRSFRGDNDSVQDSLINQIIEFYEDRELEYKVDDEFRSEDFMDNYLYWKKQDWWANYITFKDMSGFIEYAKSNDYKNRVASYYFANYQIVLPELRIFRDGAENIIEQIDQRLN